MPVQRSRLRSSIRSFLYAPSVKNLLLKIPVVRSVYPAVERPHPIDRSYGINTSGFVGVDEISSDASIRPMIVFYAGSQPSIVRTAIAALGNVEEYTFVDLGCGKGRVTTVASEFPFREVVGVELSTELADIAKENSARVAKRYPTRTQVSIIAGNVVDVPLPPGKLAYFNYHSFGPEIVAQMVSKFESGLEAGTPHLFFIYYNPVHGDLLDSSPAFERFYAAKLRYDSSERGFGPDADDTVVIWQSSRGAVARSCESADRTIIITKPSIRAELAD